MADLLDLCPVKVEVCRARGDTFPWTFTIKDSTGAAVDITGFGFLLTVDPEEDPATSANNLFQLTGNVTSGPAGIVQFSLNSTQADQVPNVYFFDLQMTDGTGKIRTVAKGPFEFHQDITK